MKRLHCFDFDGTITFKDTMIEFIRYTHGTPGLILALMAILPYLILMKLRLYPNWKSKQRLLRHCFGGMSEDQFNAKALAFATSHEVLLRPEAIATIDKAHQQGEEVMIVSASAVNWVRPFFRHTPWVKVVGTELEITEGIITGCLASPNCYGQEKVNRILKVYPNRQDYFIIAYGDSSGDTEMLAFADEAHYKPFRASKLSASE